MSRKKNEPATETPPSTVFPQDVAATMDHPELVPVELPTEEPSNPFEREVDFAIVDPDPGIPSEPTGAETTPTTAISESAEASGPPAPNTATETPVLAFDQGRTGWVTPAFQKEAPPVAFDQGVEGWKGNAVEPSPALQYDAECLINKRHIANCSCVGAARKPIAA